MEDVPKPYTGSRGVASAAPEPVTPGHVDVTDLVARCIEGEDAAQAEFYAEYSPLVERAIARRLARVCGLVPLGADVEDLRNEIFARLWRDDCRMLRRLRKPASINAWLMTIAANHTVDHVRKSSRRDQVQTLAAKEWETAYHDSPETRVMMSERKAVLERALAALPTQDRLVLDLFFVQGLRYAEIAEMTGVNLNTLSARLRRAKDKLRRILEGYGDEIA